MAVPFTGSSAREAAESSIPPHDPLCLEFQARDGTYECRCDLIVRVREDEREQVLVRVRELLAEAEADVPNGSARASAYATVQHWLVNR